MVILKIKKVPALALDALALRYFLVVAVCLLAGCESLKVEERDRGPDDPMDVSHIPEPVPRVEPRTIAGNKTPYQVLGKTYHVMPNPDGYREKGVASWYGEKFHGRRTSNGEVYDMYGMTAAHTRLPIPSYVRVTNLSNFRSVIVRVNDRGPFHGGRIIDLTYAAAKKLDFVDQGVAEVSVEYIDPLTYRDNQLATTEKALESERPLSASTETSAPVPHNTAGYKLPESAFLQVGAFSSKEAADALKLELAALTEVPVIVVPPRQSPRLYRVRIGPFLDNLEIMQLRDKLIDADFPAPHVVYP